MWNAHTVRCGYEFTAIPEAGCGSDCGSKYHQREQKYRSADDIMGGRFDS
jgi:hypothetical protein